jgi:hypothetical protein
MGIWALKILAMRGQQTKKIAQLAIGFLFLTPKPELKFAFSDGEWLSTPLHQKCNFGLVVRAVGWHTGNPGSIPGRDSLYILGCIPQHLSPLFAEIMRYIKTLI